MGGRIDQPHVRRQRENDADQAILPQVAVVARLLAIDAKVVGVDRPEQRIVGMGVVASPLLQELEPALHGGGSQPELFGRHVTVATGAPIAVESRQVAVEEGEEPAKDRSAGFPATPLVGALAGCRRVRPGQGTCQRNIEKECANSSL